MWNSSQSWEVPTRLNELNNGMDKKRAWHCEICTCHSSKVCWEYCELHTETRSIDIVKFAHALPFCCWRTRSVLANNCKLWILHTTAKTPLYTHVCETIVHHCTHVCETIVVPKPSQARLSRNKKASRNPSPKVKAGFNFKFFKTRNIFFIVCTIVWEAAILCLTSIGLFIRLQTLWGHGLVNFNAVTPVCFVSLLSAEGGGEEILQWITNKKHGKQAYTSRCRMLKWSSTI